MSYIDYEAQMVRLYRSDLYCKEAIKEFLRNAPKVDARPVKHGRWLPVTVCQVYKCSVCGNGIMTGKIEMYVYCPHCGATMDEVGE